MDLYTDVVSSGYFNISLKGDKLILMAGDYVGFIPLNNRVALSIEPKIAKNNWLRIIGKAKESYRDLTYLRAYLTVGYIDLSIIEFFAKVLMSSLRNVQIYGLLRTYAKQTIMSSVPRGKIELNRTVKELWASGNTIRLFNSYYEYAKDTPHNRLIKYSLVLLSKYFSSFTAVTQQFRSDFGDVENIFSQVPLDTSLQYLPHVEKSIREKSITESRDYYYEICETAKLIVENSGVKPAFDEGREMPSFVINMANVFQNYCFEVLQDGFNKKGAGHSVRDTSASKPLFDDVKGGRKAEPDIVVKLESGTAIPIEVKYKEQPTRSDINQAIAYALSYKAKKVLLVHYCSNDQDSGLIRIGTIGGLIEVYVYAFSISSGDLEKQENLLVEDIFQFVSS